MDDQLLSSFEEELAILYERAADFAAEFPGVAERLGGLNRETADPGIKALLEGAAFMAARVQLQLKAEFATFTNELLDQLLPGHLEPVPSCALVEAEPLPGGDASSGPRIAPAGAIMESTHRDAKRGVACRFRLASPISRWPLALEAAAYLPSTASMQALHAGAGPSVMAGLKITLQRLDSSGSQVGGKKGFAALGIDDLTFHIVGARAERDAIYEQLFARLEGIAIRHVDDNGDPRFSRLPLTAIEPIGFSRDESLFPADDRVSPGLALLREFFAFPDKYLAFRLTGLSWALKGVSSSEIDLVFEFSDVDPTLAARVSERSFRLYAAPAVNLFEKHCDRIRLSPERFEHQVVPDRSALLEYEPHRVTRVSAIYAGKAEGAAVLPLHAPAAAPDVASERAAPASGGPSGAALTFTTRRLPRRLTDQERRHGSGPVYRGTDLFLMLGESSTLEADRAPRELAVTALCSNRHLAGELSRLPDGGQMRLYGDSETPLRAIVGPTEPRRSIVAHPQPGGGPERGESLWRLIGFLSFSHSGLASHDPAAGAEALRAVLSLYADLSEAATERRLRGILALSCQPVTRRLRRPDGFHGARGIAVTLRLDDAAFEGVGVMLFGAVMERFFADLSSVNSFTETVITTPARGVVKRWPPRSGTGAVF
ncbi:type VI secretion system baseplate subunit TssF [Jiella mangrovi]|uniref:Type VI secretion system baseplate subunit TssF n=1 Tax=Jiella mangrovi TaxID=2821407 RepID=A0ABS4BIT2_9HYPH|nr:type VI secretion system baseplate subunit TssF [Jiella mangrovi]MBP0615934.1 type VI secretion system baseplate subunit TssF [Jiella mangrovi]